MWVAIAAAAGVIALVVLQSMYDDGPDPVELAAEIEAARARDGAEDYLTATRYLDGRGVARDPKAAVAYLERAAQDGNAPAQYQLGLCLRDGIGAPPDDERALHWLRTAAESGEPRAQFEVGMMYASGRGTSADLVRAYAWVTLAASRGVMGAGEARDGLLVGMSATQAAEAKGAARRLAELPMAGARREEY